MESSDVRDGAIAATVVEGTVSAAVENVRSSTGILDLSSLRRACGNLVISPGASSVELRFRRSNDDAWVATDMVGVGELASPLICNRQSTTLLNTIYLY